MPVVEIQGLRRLKGEIRIQGSKNAVLPVMAASVLCRGTVVITNVPAIQDVSCMMGILKSLGCVCSLEDHVLTIDAAGVCSAQVPAEQGGQMRSSVMLLGPLLGRLGQAETCYPGGCSIGQRPVDLHVRALQALGARVCAEDGQITAEAAVLCGGDIDLPYPSVGATENAVMAAVAAAGTTRIFGAAREPEIAVLCDFLRNLGARIEGVGQATLVIHGGRPLHGGMFAVPGDRIVAGTYMGAVMAAGGEVLLRGAPTGHMRETMAAAAHMGAELAPEAAGLLVRRTGILRPIALKTGPYPGFPTDLQSVMLAVAAAAPGESRICETVFEERFSTAKELQKLGAHIIIDGRTAIVRGGRPLRGGVVCGRDLRGGAALVVAGLAAAGVTCVRGYGFIRRGYEDICGDLQSAGADVCLAAQEEGQGAGWAGDRDADEAEDRNADGQI